MSHEHLKKKALHALFSLRRHTNLIKLKTAFALKVFDAMIPPILTCTGNSESWGVYATAHKLERHTLLLITKQGLVELVELVELNLVVFH